jgi:hypothetical protein
MRGWLGALLLVVVAGCQVEDHHRPYFHDDTNDLPEFSAMHLGQPFEDQSVTDILSPDERAALVHSDFSEVVGASDDDLTSPHSLEPPKQPNAGDKAAGIGMSLLGVGITLGAMAAPYLLF